MGSFWGDYLLSYAWAMAMAPRNSVQLRKAADAFCGAQAASI